MRALYRVIQVAQEKIQNVSAQIGQVLNQFIAQTAKEDEINQNYAYMLFETAALTLKHMSGNLAAMNEFKVNLSPVLNDII